VQHWETGAELAISLGPELGKASAGLVLGEPLGPALGRLEISLSPHSELHSEQCSDQHFPRALGASLEVHSGDAAGTGTGTSARRHWSALGDMPQYWGCTREEVDDGTDFTGDGPR
jgi:hypothetical protein